MSKPVTVGAVLRRGWLRHVGPGRPAWAPLLQPSDAQQWILREVLSRSAGGAEQPVGRPARRLDPDAERALLARMDEPRCWPLVEGLARAANALAAAITADLDALSPRPEVTPGRVSEKACTLVAAHYRAEHTVPSAEAWDAGRAAFVAAEDERSHRQRDLHSPEAFVERFTALYDRMWARCRAPSLAEARPSELGLGRLERPPMTGRHDGGPDEEDGTSSWRAGTDQCVVARYRYHLRVGWARTAHADGADRADYLDRRLERLGADELARLVVTRACAPIGLPVLPLRALVRSFVAGVATADLEAAHEHRRSPPVRTLREWAQCGTALLDEEDPQLVAAIAAEAESWVWRVQQARDLVDGVRAHHPGPWTAQVQWGTSRRMWHAAHTRQAQWDAPFSRAETASMVPKMFRHHLWELVRHPIPDPDGTQDERPLRVRDALRRNPDANAAMQRWLLDGDDRWAAVYEAVTAHLGTDRLTAAEFGGLVRAAGAERE